MSNLTCAFVNTDQAPLRQTFLGFWVKAMGRYGEDVLLVNRMWERWYQGPDGPEGLQLCVTVYEAGEFVNRDHPLYPAVFLQMQAQKNLDAALRTTNVKP
jgi:hypothetical protein